jgi:HSP20 family molecular chaperone IbpA
MTFRDLDYLFNSFFYTWPQQEKPPISREIIQDSDKVKGVRLQLALAGFAESDLQVWPESNTLKIIGNNTHNKEINDKFKCCFEKTLPVSKELDVSKASVKFMNGILEIFIPVAEKEEKKRIFLFGSAK